MATAVRKGLIHNLVQEQHCRLQAERMTFQAKKSTNAKIKKAFIDIADQYRQLADMIARGPPL